MDYHEEILAAEWELETATGPFMPVDVAITRLCESAVRVAQYKGERRAQIACAAARNVCERGLRSRGRIDAEIQQLSERTARIIAARLTDDMPDGVVIGLPGRQRYVAPLDRLRAELSRVAVQLNARDIEELRQAGRGTTGACDDDHPLPETWKWSSYDDPRAVFARLGAAVPALPGHGVGEEDDSWKAFAVFRPSTRFGLPYWEIHQPG